MKKSGGPGENHRPVASHWQSLSSNGIHLALIEVISGHIDLKNIYQQLITVRCCYFWPDIDLDLVFYNIDNYSIKENDCFR